MIFLISASRVAGIIDVSHRGLAQNALEHGIQCAEVENINRRLQAGNKCKTAVFYIAHTLESTDLPLQAHINTNVHTWILLISILC
jgi:hypothetical protein